MTSTAENNLSIRRADRLAELFAPAVVDVFAGLGGWSRGAEAAFCEAGLRDRYVDLMINHWDTAVGVHQANHPLTQHLQANVLEVDPDRVLLGRKIVYAHFSPDCTDHSKAKGGKPRRKEIRALADVVIVWAGKRRPDVITLENVEEFQQWGPLLKSGHPDKRRRGQEFARWVRELEALGYAVEWRELRVCNFGDPTTRKRLFVIARCDGKPIVWPQRTHAPANEIAEAKRRIRRERLGLDRDELAELKETAALKPWRTAAECIDWNEPMLSIFATRPEARRWAARINVGREKHERVGVPQRPLKPNTQKRLAGGLWKWVLNHAEPFIVNIQNSKWGPDHFPVHAPMPTVTANPKGGAFAGADVELATFASTLNHAGDEDRGADLRGPLATVTGANDARAVVGAELAGFVARTDMHQSNSGCVYPAEQPLTTITTANGHAAVGAEISPLITGVGGASYAGKPVPADRPLNTVMTNDRRAVAGVQVAPFTAGVGGRAGQSPSTSIDAPLPTVTGKGDRAVVAAELAPFTVPRYGEREGQAPRSGSLEQPLPTVTATDNGAQLAAVAIAKHYGGPNGHMTPGQAAGQPLDAITSKCQQGLLAVHLTQYHNDGTTRGQEADEPLKTQDTQNRYGMVAAHLTRMNHTDNGASANGPLRTVVATEHHGVVAAHLVKFRADSSGNSLDEPMPTVTSGQGAARDAGAAHAMGVACAYLSHMYTSNACGGQGDPRQPAKTITSGGQHATVCAVYLSPYYGSDSAQQGHTPAEPMPTVVGKARFGLAGVEATKHWILTPAGLRRARRVAAWSRKLLGRKVERYMLPVRDEAGGVFHLLTATVRGALHLVTDVLMRMLRPRELARAQGFEDSYVIDRTADGRRISRADQVKLIGNSVPPGVARAIVRANVVDQGVLDPIPRAAREAVPA